MADGPHPWLATQRIQDPIERRLAHGLYTILMGFGAGAIVAIPLFLVLLGVTPQGLFLSLGPGIALISALVAISVLRAGHFRPAVIIIIGSTLFAVACVIVPYGFPSADPFLIVMMFPLILAGLLGHRRMLIITALSELTIAVAATIIGPLLQPFTSAIALPVDLPLVALGTFVLMVFANALALDTLGSIQRSALALSFSREHELESLRASLETTVRERTAELQQALGEVAQREGVLQQTLQDLRDSQSMLQELSAPTIPIWEGVLVVPLIGALDSARAAIFEENTLRAVAGGTVRSVIFDITGVPIVDTQVAQVLLQTANSAQLLGAQVILVGVRPEVAQTIVALNLDFRQMTLYASLQQAVESLLGKLYNGGRRPPSGELDWNEV